MAVNAYFNPSLAGRSAVIRRMYKMRTYANSEQTRSLRAPRRQKAMSVLRAAEVERT